MIKIRNLTQNDAERYRNIRLEALSNSPDSFGTIYAENASLTVDDFKDKIPADKNSCILGYYQDRNLLGIVALHQELRTKVRHKAYIRSMYVRSRHQQKGIGKLLLSELIERAKATKEIEILLLDVVTNNVPGKKLYSSFGFQTYGIEKMAYKLNRQYFDLEYMSLPI